MSAKSSPLAAPALHRNISRRRALGLTGAAGVAGGSFLSSLAIGGAASAQDASDFKALVCVFLLGGNDQSNLIIPRAASAYNAYAAARPTLAIERSRLLSVSPQGYSGPALGFSPHLPGLRTLFEQGHCAVMANVGTLAWPVTRAQYEAASRPLPFQLFSHSDQSGQWQTGLPDRVSRTGWLGRVGDMISGSYNASGSLSIAMSIAGNNLIQTGTSTLQYQVTTEGPIPVRSLSGWGPLWQSPVASANIRKLLTTSTDHVLQQGMSAIHARAIESEAILSNALASRAPLTTRFPETYLGAQAAMVARLISIQAALGHRRQIYFIADGGYDFHDNLLEEQGQKLTALDAALSSLYAATVELGLERSVTTFTASDFGRALQHNGRGSDHGWGAHHLIIGGAVRGRRLYGAMPEVTLETSTDAGQGRLIPTTSVDEYAATLVRWFGVPADYMPTVLPNITRFATPDLGFMS